MQGRDIFIAATVALILVAFPIWLIDQKFSANFWLAPFIVAFGSVPGVILAASIAGDRRDREARLLHRVWHDRLRFRFPLLFVALICGPLLTTGANASASAVFEGVFIFLLCLDASVRLGSAGTALSSGKLVGGSSQSIATFFHSFDGVVPPWWSLRVLGSLGAAILAALVVYSFKLRFSHVPQGIAISIVAGWGNPLRERTELKHG